MMIVMIGTRRNGNSIESTCIGFYHGLKEFDIVYDKKNKEFRQGLEAIKQGTDDEEEYRHEVLDLLLKIIDIEKNKGDAPYIMVTESSCIATKKELSEMQKKVKEWLSDANCKTN